MVNFTQPLEIGNFHKGFTHLALWTSVKQAAPRLKRDRFPRRNRTLSDTAGMVTFV
ncbi:MULTISPECIES: hypothetical protein [Moorena]|uniref:hypothetical protein n=1 Tax=Moorena TaxID=1155738 RepID=UPI00131416C5|nr:MULTISPECIES: hypothetical protein [Moorena]NEO14818.1 hypothetical protein [Moorena sp. SIO3E8]NEP28428.1 hypothetical protein [Moorena sp. SIO3I6]NEP97685.1 hypothetical protein [Moorena sp. SIO3F7]